jgi:hypothetical protein
MPGPLPETIDQEPSTDDAWSFPWRQIARVETDRFQAGTSASATIEDKKVTSTSIL